MKKPWARVGLGVSACLAVCLLFSAPAFADANNFVIEQFDADYTLSADDPQGLLKIKESVQVNFSDQNHGILRALPNKYKNQSLQLKVESVSRDNASEPWTTYQSNGNTVLKIGNPDRTITGRHQYTIAYTVHNVVTFYDDHDELYWDINGDQWGQGQRAENVSVVVRLPGGLEQQRDPICYTGSFGSTAQDCMAGYNGFTNVLFAQTNRPLQTGETLSLVGGFEKGYFYPPTSAEKAAQFIGNLLKFLVPFGLIAATAGWHWYHFGRDPKGRGVIVPEYGPPDDLKPIEAGTVADFRTDNRDITATIIDLAIRGYVKIIEITRDRKILKDIKVYSLRLEQPDFSDLDNNERALLEDIFTTREQGEEVELSALKYKLADTASELRRSVKASLVTRGYFRKTPVTDVLRFVGLLCLEFVVVIVLAVIFQGAAVILGIVAGTALAAIFIILLPSRTAQGVAAKESILGLKMYLEVAEKERIKKLQSPDAPYADRGPAPKKTVELFEKLLPYAMVLGVEDAWAKKFARIYTTPPDWYQGNWTTFNAAYLVASLNSGVQSGINTAFSSPSSSSGSGFSGGGAGGGGGGGGGGGW